jgi:hypothetical protein
VIPPGGSAITIVDRLISAANIPLPGGNVWALVVMPDTTLLEVDIPAKVGDRVSCGFAGMRTGADAVDVAVVVGTAQVRYMSTRSAVPASDGDVSWYAAAGGPFFLHSSDRVFTVAAGDLDGTNVRFVVVANGNGAGIIEGDANDTFYLKAMNYGKAP